MGLVGFSPRVLRFGVDIVLVFELGVVERLRPWGQRRGVSGPPSAAPLPAV
jgi:hypothetical protein